MPSSHLILCRPLLLLPSVFPSIRVFSSEPVLRIKWPKYWSFSFSISPSNEYSGLISFMIDWFYLLAVQGTLKRLLQHHNLKVSFHRSPFLISSLQLKTEYQERPPKQHVPGKHPNYSPCFSEPGSPNILLNFPSLYPTVLRLCKDLRRF